MSTFSCLLSGNAAGEMRTLFLARSRLFDFKVKKEYMTTAVIIINNYLSYEGIWQKNTYKAAGTFTTNEAFCKIPPCKKQKTFGIYIIWMSHSHCEQKQVVLNQPCERGNIQVAQKRVKPLEIICHLYTSKKQQARPEALLNCNVAT